MFGHIIRSDGIEELIIQGKVIERRKGWYPNRYVDQIISIPSNQINIYKTQLNEIKDSVSPW